MNSTYSRQVERLVLSILLLLVFIMAARTPLDSDLWWHLRAGEDTLSTGQPVLVDSYSYTRAGSGWVNHSWLAQVGLSLVYWTGGPLALSALVALLAVLSIYWLYKAMEGPALMRAFVAVLAGVVAAPVWTARPQMASFALLSLTGLLLRQYRRGEPNRLWLLPLIFILWSNLHGGYVLGLIWIGLEIGGRLLDLLLRRSVDQPGDLRQAGMLIVVGIASGLAVLVNPNGLDTWRIPFQTVGVQSLQQLISEWASPDFHQAGQLPFLAMLLLAGLSSGISTTRLSGPDFLLLAGFGTLALFARRNFGPFSLAVAPILAVQASGAALWVWRRLEPSVSLWLTRRGHEKKRLQPEPGQSLAGAKWINLGILALLAVTAFVKWISASSADVTASYEKQLFPVDAVAWIENYHPEGRLFNSYDWGGYLIWKLRDYPVFVDGRTDLFNDEIIGQWLQVINGEPGWQKTLEVWDVGLVLIEPGWPINGQLPQAGWSVLYRDDLAVIYGR